MNRIVILLLLATIAVAAEAKEYHLFYLGGQSNMDGYGYAKELPESLSNPITDVMIFHGNQSPDQQPVDGRGVWSPLQPGHGVGFSSDGKSNRMATRRSLPARISTDTVIRGITIRPAISTWARSSARRWQN